MKLKLPGRFGQRNSQWASEILGYNTQPQYNIGMYGCLITSFGCYINQNPHDVNQLLKANNGYTAGSGNFVWSKCTVLGLNQVYQSPYYSDPVTSQGLTKMRSLIDEGRPLITHIDFDPSDPDDDQHWLIVYGYEDNDVFLAHDPWTDSDISLDVYGGVKRCVYEWRAYDKLLPADTTIDDQNLIDSLRLERDRNWGYFVAVCDALGVGANVDTAVAESKKLIGLDDALVQKDKQLLEAQTQINDLRNQLQTITSNHDSLQGSYDALQGQLNADKVTITNLTNKLQELEKQILAPVRKGWKATLVALIDKI
jgi:hypothetical protein